MKFITTYLSPVKWAFLSACILSLVHVVSALIVPTLTADIINQGVLLGDLDTIHELSLSMLGAAFITVIAAISAVYMSSHIAAQVSLHLRQQLVQALQDFSLADFSKYGTGTLLMRATRDVEKIQSVLAEGINLILPMPLMILVGLGLTFYKSFEMGLVILSLMMIMVVLMAILQKKALPIVKSVQQQLDYITDLVRDYMIGMAVIRAFNRSDDEQARETTAFSQIARSATRLSRTYAIGLPSILIIFNMSTVVILWLGGYQISAGELQIGDIMAIIEYATLILLNLVMAVFVLLDVPEAMICYQRIQELLNHPITAITNNPITAIINNPITAITNNPKSTTTGLTEAPISDVATNKVPVLEFQNVTFRYDNAEEPALQDISFTLHAGETLAIMGDIGSGKSTIAKLILGLYPIESGDILFQGQSIFKQSLTSIRRQIGYVPQKAYLFTGSIALNLQYGLGGQSLSQETMETACRLAGAHEFISRFDDGYEHQLAQGGTNLSGGQRQRLAMARALIRKPQLLIFDDSFSALDGITEQQVRKAVANEIANHPERVFISIEQKVSAARKAQKVLIINQGQAVGFGTHDELIANCPIYQQIVASQEVSA